MKRESPILAALEAARVLAGHPDVQHRDPADAAHQTDVAPAEPGKDAGAVVEAAGDVTGKVSGVETGKGSEGKTDRAADTHRIFQETGRALRESGRSEQEAGFEAAMEVMKQLAAAIVSQADAQKSAIDGMREAIAASAGRARLPENDKDALIKELQDQMAVLRKQVDDYQKDATDKLQGLKVVAEPSAKEIQEKEAADKLLTADRAKFREKYKNKTVQELEALIEGWGKTLKAASGSKQLREMYEKDIRLAEFLLEEKKKKAESSVAEARPEPSGKASAIVQPEAAAPASRTESVAEAQSAEFIPDPKKQAVLLKEIEGLSAVDLQKNMIPYWQEQAKDKKKNQSEISELKWRIARAKEIMERKKNRTWRQKFSDILNEGEPQRAVASPREKVALAPNSQELKPVSDTGIDTSDPSIDFAAREQFSAMLETASLEDVKNNILPDLTREVRAIDSELNDTKKIRSQDYRDSLETKMLEATWRREEAKRALKRKQDEKASKDLMHPVVEAPASRSEQEEEEDPSIVISASEILPIQPDAKTAESFISELMSRDAIYLKKERIPDLLHDLNFAEQEYMRAVEKGIISGQLDLAKRVGEARWKLERAEAELRKKEAASLDSLSIKNLTAELDTKKNRREQILQYLKDDPAMNEYIKEAFEGSDKDALTKEAAELEREIPIVKQVLADKKKKAPKSKPQAA